MATAIPPANNTATAARLAMYTVGERMKWIPNHNLNRSARDVLFVNRSGSVGRSPVDRSFNCMTLASVRPVSMSIDAARPMTNTEIDTSAVLDGGRFVPMAQTSMNIDMPGGGTNSASQRHDTRNVAPITMKTSGHGCCPYAEPTAIDAANPTATRGSVAGD
jgi:hypothetical protein